MRSKNDSLVEGKQLVDICNLYGGVPSRYCFVLKGDKEKKTLESTVLLQEHLKKGVSPQLDVGNKVHVYITDGDIQVFMLFCLPHMSRSNLSKLQSVPLCFTVHFTLSNTFACVAVMLPSTIIITTTIFFCHSIL